jgi:hypothetical protein
VQRVPSVSGLLLVLSLAVTAGGCKRGAPAEPPCSAVGAKFLALAKDALATSRLAEGDGNGDVALRRAVLDQLPAMRDSLVAACTETKWSGAVRACLVEARDHLAFAACQQQLTDEQRQALEHAGSAASGERASIPSR